MKTKRINGVSVPMTAEEEAAFDSAAAASEAKRAAREAARGGVKTLRATESEAAAVLAAMIGPASPAEAQAWKARYEAAKAGVK